MLAGMTVEYGKGRAQPLNSLVDVLNLSRNHQVEWGGAWTLACRGGRSHLFPLGRCDGGECGNCSAFWGQSEKKKTHGESRPLVCRGLHKGQRLGGRGANVVHPALLETAQGCALVGGRQPPVASATDGMIETITCVSTLGEFFLIFVRCISESGFT